MENSLSSLSGRILKPGSARLASVREFNANACKLLGAIVQSSLGPRAMDKLVVKDLNLIVTSDGYAFLESMGVDHPAAKVIVEASKTVDQTVGDGTTSVVVLASSLIEKAQELISKGVNPSLVIEGYQMAEEKAEKIIADLEVRVDPTSESDLLRITSSCLGTKVTKNHVPHLARLVVDAALLVQESSRFGNTIDIDNTIIVKKSGGSLSDSQMLSGVAIRREPASHTMPRTVKEAKIALITHGLHFQKSISSPEVRINSPEQMIAFKKEERNILAQRAERVARTGANVVLCKRGMADSVQMQLGRMGILGVRTTYESEMKNVAKATGARIVSDVDTISSEDLGYAKSVDTRKLAGDEWLFFEGCKNPRCVTLLLRGGSERVVEDAGRVVHDALMVLKDVLEHPAIVAGGGAFEIQVAHELNSWARRLSGRTQLAAMKYAEALEIIPQVLARSAGMDSLDALVELRARHARGETSFGVDATSAEVADMHQRSVIDAARVKVQVLKSATESAINVLRVDEMIVTAKSPPPPRAASRHGRPLRVM